MQKLLFITLLTTFLYANNPLPYAALGDVIYDNVETIAHLKTIESYDVYKDDIEKYVSDVQATKEMGYELQKKTSNILKKEYLNKLRELSKKNDYYLRSIQTNYKESMKNNNYKLFSQIINNKLIDVQKHKKEIIDYYYAHQDNIDKEGVIEDLLNEDAKLRALKEAQKKHYKTKKQLEAERIQRIRENDRAERLKIEEDLEKDLNKKKEEIRKLQIKELSR